MDDSRYCFGVDGGQTSTKCALVTNDGRVLGYGVGGGLTHLAVQGSRERFVVALRGAFASAWRAAGLTPQPVVAVGLGLTGVEANTPEAATVEVLVREVVVVRHVEAHSDAYTALLGAHNGEPGIITIAGTGSHILGMNGEGRIERAGGWGWLLGDEGSAMWIGRSGLAAALHANDGVGQSTLLEDLMLDHFKIASLRDVKRLIYESSFGSRGFAALAAIVSRAAEQGDEVAVELVNGAARDLAAQVRAVQHRLGLPADTPTAPVGGAFEHVHGLRDRFVTSLRAMNAEANVVQPQQPPVIGAALMALKWCGD